MDFKNSAPFLAVHHSCTMASNFDITLDAITTRKFDNKKFYDVGYSGGGYYGPKNTFYQEKPSDLRSVLAKKQPSNVTDLRSKLKRKALYTRNLASKSQPPVQLGTVINGNSDANGRKKLQVTASFKNSVSSAVAGSGSSEGHKSTRPHSRKSDMGPLNRHRTSSNRLPSYEEAKKISVTVPGLSRPVSEVRC